MAKTNDIVFRSTPSSVFVTLMFGMLDTESGRLVYCSAGHTRGIVKRSNGDVELLEVQSPLTGAFPTMEFVNGQTSIAQGDALILCTDGVTEARRDSEMLGEEGLVGLVRVLGAVPTGDIPEAIFADVLDYAGGRLADDVAIVSVGRT
jgi:sigma-B regulation protein RsbU (phosphoserine phosphatase)